MLIRRAVANSHSEMTKSCSCRNQRGQQCVSDWALKKELESSKLPDLICKLF